VPIPGAPASFSPQVAVYGRLRVQGLLLEDVMGFNPLRGAQWNTDIDQLSATGQIRLALGLGSESLSPFPNISSLDQLPPKPGHRFDLETAVVDPPGQGPPFNWQTVWSGEIDAVDVSGEEAVLTCRDLMCIAMDTIVEPTDADVWGFWREQESLQARLQGIQDTVAVYAPEVADLNLRFAEDPDWTVIGSWTDAGISLAEAWHRTVLQRGFAMHYRYFTAGVGSDRAGVTIYDPLRGVDVADWTINPGEVIRFTRFSLDRTLVRNRIRVPYGTGQNRGFEIAENTSSQDAFGRRFMQPGEEFMQEIDTSTEAQRVAGAALVDLSAAFVNVDYERPYMWHVELSDSHILPANMSPQRVASTPLNLRVTGYQHSLDFRENGQFRTIVRTIGGGAAAKRRWQRVEQKKVHVSLDEPFGGAPSGSEWYQVDDLTPVT
jgi:hypothetical protein